MTRFCVQDSEKFAEADKVVKERMDERTKLESYAYRLKTETEDEEKLGGKLSEEAKKELKDAAEVAIEFLDSNQEATAEELKEEYKKLEKVAHPIVSKLYENKGGAGPEGESEGEGESDHDEL